MEGERDEGRESGRAGGRAGRREAANVLCLTHKVQRLAPEASDSRYKASEIPEMSAENCCSVDSALLVGGLGVLGNEFD